MLGILSICIRTEIDPRQHSETDIMSLSITFRSTGQLLSELKLFLKESEHNALQAHFLRTAEILQKTTNLLINRNTIPDFKKEANTIYQEALKITADNNLALFSLNK